MAELCEAFVYNVLEVPFYKLSSPPKRAAGFLQDLQKIHDFHQMAVL